MKFAAPLRGGLKIFAGVFLLESLIVGGHTLLRGLQEPLWKDPLVLLVPLAMGLLLAVGKGLWELRRAKARAPGSVVFDRYGFSIFDEGGVSRRISWRLLSSAILEERPEWRWRFVFRGPMEVILSSGHYPRERWKELSEELARRLKRRKIDVRVISAGQIDPEASASGTPPSR